MLSEHREQVHKWIREVTDGSPNERNTTLITDKVITRRFTTIYRTVELCRQLVEVGINVIVRKFLKQYSTEPDLNDQDQNALFDHYGVHIEDEKTLLKRIAVTVWVPLRDKFCNVYDREDCSPEELDEAAEYLDKMALEIHERAQYLRLLADYRRQNS